MDEKKPKMRRFDVILAILVIVLAIISAYLYYQNFKLETKLTALAKVVSYDRNKAKENTKEVEEAKEELEEVTEDIEESEDTEESIIEQNKKKYRVTIPDENSSLEERVAYLEKRLKEDNYANSNYEMAIADYIDSVAEIAISGNKEEAEVRDAIQKYFTKTDIEESETMTGHSHIVLSVERQNDGSFIAHTIFREEQGRTPIDFKVTLDGRGNVISCDYIER